MAKLKGKARAKARHRERTDKRIQKKSYLQKHLDLIRKWDDPILSEVCDVVETTDSIEEMIRIMGRVLSFSKNGVGLAAPQVGYKKRIIAVKVKHSIRIFINPEIISYGGNLIKSEEGCLSYPGISAVVERYPSVKIKYQDHQFISQEEEFKDFLAVVIQHEVDHIDGICKVGDEWKERKDAKDKTNNSER